MRAWLLAAWLAVAAPRVSVSVSPQIVMANHSIVVACHVPRNASNRGLDIVLIPVQATYRQLDGDDALITNTIGFARVPCDATGVACILHTQGEADLVAQLPLLVAGCGE